MSMLQIRIHGRGGQGVVTAAEMLSIAAFREGKHAQAFPSFGSERTGAPVVAYCRIDEKEIRLREPVMQLRAAECPCGAIDMVPESI
jgi:pyruvate ferredoxin oxidoreductase gamma subunit